MPGLGGLLDLAVAALLPIAAGGALLLAALRRPRRLLRPLPWLPAWLGALALPIAALAAAGRAGAATQLLGQALLAGLAAAVLVVPPGRALRGLTWGLALLLLAAGVEGWARTTAPEVVAGAGTVVRTGPASFQLRSGEAPTTYRLSWLRPVATPAALALEVRHREGELGRDWARSNPGVRIEPIAREPGAVRVVGPEGRYHHVARSWSDGRPLAGRTFRFEAELRAEQPLRAMGCRGLQLEAHGGGAPASSCRPVALGPEWRAAALEWTVPPGTAGTELRALLIDFGTVPVEVRSARLLEVLDEGTVVRAPLTPVGITAALATPTTVAPVRRWRPGAAWERLELAFPGEAAPTTLTLTVEGGQRIDLRGLRFLDARRRTVPALPAPEAHRVRLWFGHPNLLAHTAAVATVGVALLPGAPTAGLLAGLALLLLAGSRTAIVLAVAGVGFAWWSRSRLPRRLRWALVAVGLGVGLAASLALGPALGRLDPWAALRGEAVNPISRPTIWGWSWRAITEHPWTGLPGPFADFLRARSGLPDYAIPEHAHNFWLHLGVLAGFPGLAGALLLTTAMIVLSVRLAGTRGLVLTAIVLCLNLFDVSLFYTGVLGVWLLLVNTLARRLVSPDPMGDNRKGLEPPPSPTRQ